MLRLLLCVLFLIAGSAAALAQPVTLSTELVAEGLDQPVFLTSVPGDGRLLVVEQSGRIRVLGEDREPVLDLSAAISSGGERGLLGLALHPDFASNGRFYVDYTDRRGDTQVVAYTTTPDLAAVDPDSGEPILSVDQPYANHNGGWLAFGPDGKLYVGMGDGGSGGDPQGNGQDPEARLGKILTIDVDGGNTVSTFALGVRNPWRNAFDGDMLYVADVGQSMWEEVTAVPLSAAGANLGWNRMEGLECFRRGCDTSGLVLPQHVYSHDEGCSITGGYVYRGKAIPEIVGDYFFADFCSGKVWSFRLADGQATGLTDWTAQIGKDQISSFGVDAGGELYIVSLSGSIWRIVKG